VEFSHTTMIDRTVDLYDRLLTGLPARGGAP
jgi:hypothetical protein